MMKTKLFLALLLAGLLAVLLIPTGFVHAAPRSPDQNPVPEVQPAPLDQSLPASAPPVVQIAIGLVMLLFGCIALAPLAQPDDSLRSH